MAKKPVKDNKKIHNTQPAPNKHYKDFVVNRCLT